MATVYTQAGEEAVVDILDGTIAVPTYHIGWGTGSTAAAKGDTALETEDSDGRAVAALSQPSADVNRFVGTITSTGTKTITEAGLFDQEALGGTLFIRGDFTGIALETDDAIEFTIDLEQT